MHGLKVYVKIFWNVTNSNVQQISTFIVKIGKLCFITQYNNWQYSCTRFQVLPKKLLTCVRLQHNKID